MNHLGFSVKEANGTLVLILILGIFIFVPPLFNRLTSDKSADFKIDQSAMLQWKKEFEVINKPALDNKNLSKGNFRNFNPNIVSSEDWIEFGIKPAVARRIVKYRNAGGSFQKGSDLFRIFGIDSLAVVALIPYMQFDPEKEMTEGDGIEISEIPEDAVEELPIEIKISINSASADELRSIYGIGEKLSERIIRYRAALGGFHALGQLSEVYFFQDSLLPKIEQKFSFELNQITPLYINTDSLERLKSHPYLNYNQARAIVNYREVHGKFSTTSDLLAIKIIPDSTFEKLKPYISVKE